MRKIIALTLCLLLLVGLTGCMEAADNVTFYYVRYNDSYTYGQPNAVIAGEYRDVTGHSQDLNYLLTLYFHGPTMEYLRTPFPNGMSLRSVELVGDTLYVHTSSSLTLLRGTDLTLACACLAQTCFDLTDEAASVTITADGLSYVSMTLSRDSIMLMDDTPIPND